MSGFNSSIDNNTNKDSGNSKDKEIVLLYLSENLQKENIVSEIKYMLAQKSLKIIFSKDYNNIVLDIPGNVKNWYAWTAKIEEKIKKDIPNLNEKQRMLIENTLKNNIDLILDVVEDHAKKLRKSNNQKENGEKEEVKKIYLKKYILKGKLYESILLNNVPKFITLNTTSSSSSENNNNEESTSKHNNNIQFELFDKIDIPSYALYPTDTPLTRNPIPYSFESEDEIKKYIELAKNETFDTLFEKILIQIRDYVNTEEHVLVVLAADILYSYFQEKFGTTHYNIFIGDNGSGKNSVLLFFKMLGYRVFYVTAASAANYYTFLGEIQEGQGTIAEDEADDIGYNKDKQKILKTGYARDGNVPKIEFTNNGSRNQASYLTFCYKWLAMEELPDEKEIKGVIDRSFIYKCIVGDVKYNIKDILKDEDSIQHKDLVHIRKLLFVFKLINQNATFSNIKLNIKNRNAELTLPLLKIFYKSNSFNKIRIALSELVNEKTYLKSTSLESSIADTLKTLVEKRKDDEDKDILEFTNELFYWTFKEITDAREDLKDYSDSLYFQDGTKTSKHKISLLLSSKFKAKLVRTSKNRGFQINKKDVEKISKQYEVVDEITVLDNDEEKEKEKELENKDKSIGPSISGQTMTDMTQMTHSEGAISLPSISNNDIISVLNEATYDNIKAKEEIINIKDKDNINVDNLLPISKDITDIEDKSNEKDDGILNDDSGLSNMQSKERDP